MIVHIGGGIRARDDEFLHLRAIIEVVHDLGGAVAHNWIEIANHNVTQKFEYDEDVDWDGAVQENDYAMSVADLYIAETTAYRLYHGYEVARALEKGIPVLMVSRTSFRPYAISGVKNKLLTMKTYEDTEELADIVREFIHAHEISPESRYVQVPIDREINGYLVETSKRQGKTRGEVLSDLAHAGLKLQKLLQEETKK